MAFTDLTSTASIRAVLGVSELELRDDVLLNAIYAVELTETLYALHVDLFDDFVIAAAADPRSSLQQRFVDLVQTFAAYSVARQCLGSVAMFAPQTIKDARSELTRTTDPYKALKEDVPAALAILRTRLLTVYAQVNTDATAPSAVERIRLVASPLGVNPVTG